ncbi:MAG: ATPase [Deltaproteobacteria bacterium]|nr:MAG: ATPase [Deltaproteobacteria bacterium]
MIGIKNSVRVLLLLFLCLTVPSGLVWATGDAGHAGQTSAVHDSVPDDAAHHDNGKKIVDLFWRVLNFAVLVLILVKFGAKPIAEGLSGRQKAIAEEVKGLEAKRDAAEAAYKEFSAKLAGMEKDIDIMVEKAVAQAEIEKTKIFEKAEQAADDIKRQAEMAVQNEVTEARRNLKNEMAEGAAMMAEELIIKNLTEEDQVRIIEDYLSKVGAVQ